MDSVELKLLAAIKRELAWAESCDFAISAHDMRLALIRISDIVSHIPPNLLQRVEGYRTTKV